MRQTDRRNGLPTVILAMTLYIVIMGTTDVRAQSEAQAASGPPLTVALLVDSDTNRCYDRGYTDAIERLATLERDEINARGGIAGRRLELLLLDSKREADLTIANLRTALRTPELLAIVGLSSSTRAEQAFNELGDEIGGSGVPFISNVSVGDIVNKYENVYSTRPSQEAERAPVMAAFANEMGFASVGFLGLRGVTYVDAIAGALKRSAIADRIVADHRITRLGNGARAELNGAQLDQALLDLKAQNPALVVLAVGTSRSGEVIAKMKAAAFTPAILLVGNLTYLPPDITQSYPNAMYQLDWDTVPEVDQDAVRSVVTGSNPEDWLFGGTKLPAAEGWQNGSCPQDYVVEPFSDTNLRAIAIGARFSDMVKLIAQSGQKAGSSASITQLRQALLDGIGKTYAAGRGSFRGRFENWSFYPDLRVRAATPFVIILPQGLGRTQLAPIQFARTRSGTLRRVDTLYLDVDMIRTRDIDNDRKSFFAEFYLAMRANSRLGIEDLSFTNAFIDPRTNGPQLAIEVVHPGGASDAYPESMQLYRISGVFRFQPDFSAYPFDSQQFSIDIQPKNGDKPFVIQPPPPALRDAALAVDNWWVASQYVSYLHDFVPVVDAFTHEPSIVPFYKTRFVWQLTRETTDYYLRVIIPLAFILIVAYLSIFIPQTHLEAIVTIQVTALLSAVALYLSLPQIDSDTATVSDRIFVLDYMMVSLMIVISILRINARVSQLRWLNYMLTSIHIVVIPIIVVGVVAVLLRALPTEAVRNILG